MARTAGFGAGAASTTSLSHAIARRACPSLVKCTHWLVGDQPVTLIGPALW